VERSSLPFSINVTTDSCTIEASRNRTSWVTLSVSRKRRVWPFDTNSFFGKGNTISAIIIPDSGISETSTSSWFNNASHTFRVTRATSSRPSMRGEPIKKRTPHPSLLFLCANKRKCCDATKSSLKVLACAAPSARSSSAERSSMS